MRTSIRTGLFAFVWAVFVVLACSAAAQASWDSAAENVAEQIAGALRAGPAHLTLENMSSISAEDVGSIQRDIEQFLRGRGIALSADESAATIRVTLSENMRERIWVAEITRNGETKVVMVPVPVAGSQAAASGGEMTLHRQRIATAHEPVLAGMQIVGGFVGLEADRVVFFPAQGEELGTSLGILLNHAVSRDPRGVLFPAGQKEFSAWLPGVECDGTFPDAQSGREMKVQCRAGDDPWPIGGSEDASSPGMKAFYNSARDFFTGVTVPTQTVELPAFYSASPFARGAGGSALLLTSTERRVMLLEGGQLRPVAGTREWGSDFAIVRTGCGEGVRAIVSSAGSGASDSLRAYKIIGTNAEPASAALPINGSVIAIWAAQDGNSAFATVRNPMQPGSAETYEVDRVTATCN